MSQTPTPGIARPGIECPRCGAGTYVSRTINWVSWIQRIRTCHNPSCRYTFDTSERIVSSSRTTSQPRRP